MKLKNLLQPSRLTTFDPDLTELIRRVEADHEITCPYLERSEIAFIGAIYNEVQDNPLYSLSPHMRELVQTVNAKMSRLN